MGILGRLQIYVLTRTLAGLAAALVVITSVVMLISFVELSRSYGGRSDVGFVRLVELMLLQAPSIILLLLPFIFLFGTMAAFVTLNRRSELIAMRAAGVSAWRFIFPAAVAAFLIGVVDITVLNPVAAELNGRYEDAKTAIYLASSPDVAAVSGKYFIKCAPVRPSGYGRDDGLARRIWTTSEMLLGMRAADAA